MSGMSGEVPSRMKQALEDAERRLRLAAEILQYHNDGASTVFLKWAQEAKGVLSTTPTGQWHSHEMPHSCDCGEKGERP